MGFTRRCKKCSKNFPYDSEDCYWDYEGITPVKVIKCPHCKCIQAIKYGKIYNINNDIRFFNTQTVKLNNIK